MNSVNLIGRLTKDPEPRTTQNGITALTFCIAVDRGDKDHNTDFVDIQAWRSTAEFISKYFHKGDPITVTGSLRTRTYEKDGRNVKVTDVLASEVGFVPRTSGSGTKSEPEPQEDVPFEF